MAVSPEGFLPIFAQAKGLGEEYVSAMIQAYTVAEERLAAAAEGLWAVALDETKPTDWRRAFAAQQLAQVRHVIAGLKSQNDEFGWCLEQLYALGYSSVEGYLNPGGLSKMAHPGDVTQMDLGMSALARREINALVASSVTKLNHLSGGVGREVEDLYRASAMKSKITSLATGLTVVQSRKTLTRQIRLGVLPIRKALAAGARAGRSPDDVLADLVKQGQISEKMISSIKRLPETGGTGSGVANWLKSRAAVTEFVDKTGRRWGMGRYVDMVSKTMTTEAQDKGLEACMRESGQDLVKVNPHPGTCKKCERWEGRILSLWGKTPGYPTLAEAKAQGFRHPKCRHVLMPHIAGIGKYKAQIKKAYASPTGTITGTPRQHHLTAQIKAIADKNPRAWAETTNALVDAGSATMMEKLSFMDLVKKARREERKKGAQPVPLLELAALVPPDRWKDLVVPGSPPLSEWYQQELVRAQEDAAK